MSLAAWSLSSDLEKKEQWDAQKAWARQHALGGLIPSENRLKMYVVDEPTLISPAAFSKEWKWGGDGPKKRPSRDAVDRALAKLREDWVSICGQELGGISRPLRFTGKRRRRLLVGVHGEGSPPWGSWFSTEKRPHKFKEFRRKINHALQPLEVDHIDFKIME